LGDVQLHLLQGFLAKIVIDNTRVRQPPTPLLENNPFYTSRNMNIFGGLEDCKGSDPTNPHSQNNKATIVQLVISLTLGLSSFIAFCVSRLKQLFSTLR